MHTNLINVRKYDVIDEDNDFFDEEYYDEDDYDEDDYDSDDDYYDDYDDEEDEYDQIGWLRFNALNPGEATVTVEANGVKTSFKVIVRKPVYDIAELGLSMEYMLKLDGKFEPSKLKVELSNPSVAEVEFDDYAFSDDEEGGYVYDGENGYIYLPFTIWAYKGGKTEVKIKYDGTTVYSKTYEFKDDYYDDDGYDYNHDEN